MNQLTVYIYQAMIFVNQWSEFSAISVSSFATLMTNIRNLQNFCNTSFSQQKNIKIKILHSINVVEYEMYLQCIEM